jgi:pimeloyl-ACP methyl ester carboxylesterase
MAMIAVPGGAELHYDDSGGAGAPILFSHGLLWSGRMYDAQVAALRVRYRCVTYDHRGQGRSPQSPTPYDMDVLTDDAAAIISGLGLAPCHFVGLSMGGFVGLRLAIGRPELLRSLVLIDTAADAEPRWNVPKYRALSLAARLIGYKPLLGEIMRTMFAAPFRTDPARADARNLARERLLGLREPPTRAALESVLRRRPVEADLGRIRTPTLVVHGADDRAIVPARARRMADAISGARWVTIPGAGHSSTMEEPEAVTAAIAGFVDEISRQPAAVPA